MTVKKPKNFDLNPGQPMGIREDISQALVQTFVGSFTHAQKGGASPQDAQLFAVIQVAQVAIQFLLEDQAADRREASNDQ